MEKYLAKIARSVGRALTPGGYWTSNKESTKLAKEDSELREQTDRSEANVRWQRDRRTGLRYLAPFGGAVIELGTLVAMYGVPFIELVKSNDAKSWGNVALCSAVVLGLRASFIYYDQEIGIPNLRRDIANLQKKRDMERR